MVHDSEIMTTGPMTWLRWTQQNGDHDVGGALVQDEMPADKPLQQWEWQARPFGLAERPGCSEG